jgi:hypothetical protein
MIQYTYYNAVKPDGSPKAGVNRITWEDNNSQNPQDWTEIIREYFLEDPRNSQQGLALQAVLNASQEEIAEIKKILGIQ